MIDYEGAILARAEAYDAGEIGDWCDVCPYFKKCENENFGALVWECYYDVWERELRENEG